MTDVEYRVEIRKAVKGQATSRMFGSFAGDRNQAMKWLQDQIKALKKEPYLAPRFEGEEPLPGLEQLKPEPKKSTKQHQV